MTSNRKIKVLNVLPLGTVGGAENYVLDLCRHHDKERFEVTVCVLFRDGVVTQEMVKNGYDVSVLNMANGFDVIRATQLISLIKQKETDIVNIHGQNPLGKFFSLISSSPFVIHTDHGTSVGSPVRRKRRVVLANRLLSPFIDHFIAISHGMRESLEVRERIPRSKISIIYNGVDVNGISKVSCDKQRMRELLNIPENIPVIGTVGRLAPEKQYPLLLASLAVLKHQGFPFVALIIGDGPERKHLESMCRDMDLSSQIRFLGQRNDVFELLDFIDLFAFPSGGEAFSIILLEAMAKATPVVAFDVEGVREAIDDNQSGILVPFADVNAFAESMRLVIQRPEFGGQLAANGLKKIRRRFSIQTTVGKLETLYENVMENGASFRK